MTTRSGRVYKTMAEVNWDGMLQGLAEGRRKRSKMKERGEKQRSWKKGG